MRKYKMPSLGKFVSVENMRTNWGWDAPNQFEIEFEKGRVFQSYNSTIVVIKDGQVYLGEDWNYSRTTGKYRSDFLGEHTAETKAKIESWEYKLLNI